MSDFYEQLPASYTYMLKQLKRNKAADYHNEQKQPVNYILL
jgi:hypothetical protein